MQPTKTFPKYWVVNVQENADHELLPKFKNWYKVSTGDYHWEFSCRYYGYTGILWYSWFSNRDDISGFANNPSIITLEEWNTIFFPNEKKKKEVPSKKIKNTTQYKKQKALAEHYRDLFTVGVEELRFSNLEVQTFTDALDEIVAMTTDPLAKKVAQMAKEKHNVDKLIHARKLFGNK
jgi:hypothetical protein